MAAEPGPTLYVLRTCPQCTSPGPHAVVETLADPDNPPGGALLWLVLRCTDCTSMFDAPPGLL